MKNTINIFSETGCIPHEILWKYRQGTLSASEKHAVEVHLTDCELCSDALAGMMDMNSDEMIAGLRKSVRNISAPKKVIRFYDYRVLSAAAAIAVLFVFAYVINSNKNDTKEIAQLVKPEEKKSEQQISLDIATPQQDTTSTLTINKSSSGAEKANLSAQGVSSPLVIQNQIAVIPDADKKGETAAEGDMAGEVVAPAATESGYSTPAQTAAPASRDQEKALASSSTKNQMRKKSAANDESSKVMYFNDLKVARTPAMTETEKFDTVNTGTPAMYENAIQKSAATETPARPMPFVYSKTLRDGMNYFQNNQYYEASQTFSIILERFPNDVNSQFYKGLSEMEMQNYSPSAALLNQVMLNSDKTFYEEAKFKLALCYKYMNQEKAAKKLLREIKEEKGFYSEKASQELEQLK